MKKTVLIFICHGNICRSTMAEFLFRDLLAKKGMADRFDVFSRATSTEELGNPVHPGTRRILDRLGISCLGKTAKRITKEECAGADYLIVMDENNRRNLRPFLNGKQDEKKVYSLLEFAGDKRGISDPWYTGDFEATYRDVDRGCRALLSFFEKEKRP